MKYCYTCSRYFTDEFLFCTQCGRSFGVRYCRNGLHLNSTASEYCRECGSSDLSTPDEEPQDSMPLKVLIFAAALLGLVLAVTFVIASLRATESLPSGRIFLFMIGIAITLVSWTSFRRNM